MTDAGNTSQTGGEKPAFERVMLKISGEALMAGIAGRVHPGDQRHSHGSGV